MACVRPFLYLIGHARGIEWNFQAKVEFVGIQRESPKLHQLPVNPHPSYIQTPLRGVYITIVCQCSHTSCCTLPFKLWQDCETKDR